MANFCVFLRLTVLCSVTLSQAYARSKHFLIETADEKAVDEPASLNRQGSYPVGGPCSMMCDEESPQYDNDRCAECIAMMVLD